MPISYRCEGPVLLLEASGEYSPAELKATVGDGLAAVAGDAKPLLLFDLRKSSSLAHRSGDDVRGMAGFLRSLNDRIGPRVAMVTSGDAEYGLMRMGSAYIEVGGVTGEVFPDIESARRWLVGGTPQ